LDAYNSFKNLERDKQETIRRACLEEFVRTGYSSASTNTMCKNAAISKGLLFYHFGSKKQLFVYLIDYCSKFLSDIFYGGLELKKENIFERTITLTLRKWALYERYPLEYGFLVKLLIDCPPDIEQKLIQMKKDNLKRATQIFMHNLDLSDLRPDIDKAKAVELVLFVMEGFKAKNIEKYKTDPKPLSELHGETMLEMKEYLNMCRLGICS